MTDMFEVGDLVKLKSGGPVMTISEIVHGINKDGYNCKWFKGASKEQAFFEEEVLKIYEAPKKND
jgi:uncharacterized protein YodC (DUF2158 family)